MGRLSFLLRKRKVISGHIILCPGKKGEGMWEWIKKAEIMGDECNVWAQTWSDGIFKAERCTGHSTFVRSLSKRPSVRKEQAYPEEGRRLNNLLHPYWSAVLKRRNFPFSISWSGEIPVRYREVFFIVFVFLTTNLHVLSWLLAYFRKKGSVYFIRKQ